MVNIDNLSYSFEDTKVLDNINLNIEKGKFYSIIGPNGSGKTTLFKNISKALQVPRNTIFIENKDITRIASKDMAKKVSCVPQDTNIEFDFSVIDIVLMGRTPYLRMFQDETDEDIQIAKMAMEMTNTWHLKDKKINQISGGERQRVIIARAIAQSTQIILLDEPISNLDIHNQIEILDTIKKLNKEKNLTVISILHDLNLALAYSDEIFLLNKGKIVSKGDPHKVLTEENIKNVYNMKVNIIKNPLTGNPYIIPVFNQFI
ncbi:iron complex transport system ATP-binding protein [Alkalithermobacter thermoalcaliphilus JW-YL-7 = DSM 7308]|uniref:Iron complex transport system ATP-binding protein n=1 Tax=Alkalithermobacter thermoalcaliphilus JW-YL-7 = DSM 7308 TaxID=1121328 RepID=A0A150FU23_CLOPD|nr:Iron-chelate-transporting ATPase [[Clostridium] paradoxum JW-YL-7 = DSM 7308]SHL18080.1 iron complex transport system ATP-binding protein [[Clostridium] paradoxum JW-YL-7 = DSM 7308]